MWSPWKYVETHASSVFNDSELWGCHITLRCAKFCLSESAFKKKAEKHLPPLCRLYCQECAKTKSLCTGSDGWSRPSLHVSDMKEFCFLSSLIMWKSVMDSLAFSQGHNWEEPADTYMWTSMCIKTLGILLIYLKFEFSGEEKNKGSWYNFIFNV